MDFYDIGTLLYEHLTDYHSFNQQLSEATLALAIELVSPVHTRQFDPHAPSGLNDLTMHLLAKKPEQRAPRA